MVLPIFLMQTTTTDVSLVELPGSEEPGEPIAPMDVNVTQNHTVVLAGLSPGSEYLVQVAAWTGVGRGPWSPAVSFKTLSRQSSESLV